MARGTPQRGGRWTSRSTPEAPASVIDLSPPRFDPYLDDEADDIVPQANSPEKVVLSVDALADGCATNVDVAEKLGVDRRQGSYYLTAARHLGLVEPAGGGRWTLTADGVVAANADNRTLTALLDSRLAANPHVGEFLDGGEEALVESWSARGDIGEETVARRVSTIRAWADYATDSDEARLSRISACRAEIRGRHVTVLSPARRQVRRCRTCNIDLPSGNSGDLCDDCAV